MLFSFEMLFSFCPPPPPLLPPLFLRQVFASRLWAKWAFRFSTGMMLLGALTYMMVFVNGMSVASSVEHALFQCVGAYEHGSRQGSYVCTHA